MHFSRWSPPIGLQHLSPEEDSKKLAQDVPVFDPSEQQGDQQQDSQQEQDAPVQIFSDGADEHPSRPRRKRRKRTKEIPAREIIYLE